MEAVEIAGIKISKIYHTANTKMEFRHPKYYKELRKRNNSDQVISGASATASVQRAPGPGLQVTSHKLQSLKLQAASLKPQAASVKLQAASNKLLDNLSLIKFHVSRSEVLHHDKCIVRMPYMEGNLVW